MRSIGDSPPFLSENTQFLSLFCRSKPLMMLLAIAPSKLIKSRSLYLDIMNGGRSYLRKHGNDKYFATSVYRLLLASKSHMVARTKFRTPQVLNRYFHILLLYDHPYFCKTSKNVFLSSHISMRFHPLSSSPKPSPAAGLHTLDETLHDPMLSTNGNE